MTGFSRISPDDARQLIDKGDVLVVDIRDEDSFAAGRIRGARHLDNSGLQAFMDTAEFDEPVIVCCYHGLSSQSAGAFLVERGFDEVYSLDGGYTEWFSRFPDCCEPSTAS